jgi:hypothetical protein
MTTVLILHIELDPDSGTEAEVAEYGRNLVMFIEERRAHEPHLQVSVEARAAQVLHASVETR